MQGRTPRARTLTRAFDRAVWTKPVALLLPIESIEFGEYRFVPAGQPNPAALIELIESRSDYTDPPEAKEDIEALLRKMRAV